MILKSKILLHIKLPIILLLEGHISLVLYLISKHHY